MGFFGWVFYCEPWPKEKDAGGGGGGAGGGGGRRKGRGGGDSSDDEVYDEIAAELARKRKRPFPELDKVI